MDTPRPDLKKWLPTTRKELKLRNWEQLDVILFSGDAYVDHPAFGAAVIGRLMESYGLQVAIVPQPNWQDDLRDFKKLGVPRLFFAVTSGNMDSMVNHYTANKRLRSNDAYTAGGKSGARPDYATTVYTRILKKLYPDVPVVLGGIEASMRRLAHYDYWSDSLKPSILAESGADLLIYGMGEAPLTELLRLLLRGVPFDTLRTVPQTAFAVQADEKIPKNSNWHDYKLFSFEHCQSSKQGFASNFKIIETESNTVSDKRLMQAAGMQTIAVNPPYNTLSNNDIDNIYDLPFTRLPHPKYNDKGAIPAYEMIKFSVNIHRGCFGGCSFCTISAHQGKFISSRSAKSVLKEVEQITQMPDFKGHISDLGGPSANMYQMQGIDLEQCKICKRPSCIFPAVCSNLNSSHKPLTQLYYDTAKIPGVKKLSIGSGIRYDLLIDKKNEIKNDKLDYLRQLVQHHVSGRLKIAPEHTSDLVLKIMRKPSFKTFHIFKKAFDQINNNCGLNQQLIPYFISSHPGSTEQDMAELALETKQLNFQLEQVQDFTPTPMTLATVMYYTGLNPYTDKKVFVAKNKNEKLAQRRFFFWYKKEYRSTIHKSLIYMGQKELADKLLR